MPAAMVGSRSTAARVMRGATSLSNSSHFAPIAYSKAVNPVVLPPGRAKLSTKPAPTGSMTPPNTIGTVRVACCTVATLKLVSVRMTSGASATSSAAYLRAASILPAVQRTSRRALWPSAQPNSASRCTKAVS